MDHDHTSPLANHPDEAAAAALPLPPLPQLAEADSAYLEYFFALREDPIQVAIKTSARYIDILAWMSRPEIAAYLNAARAARARLHRDEALAELSRIIKTSPDQTERRRAATTLLRSTAPASPRPASRLKHAIAPPVAASAITDAPAATAESSHTRAQIAPATSASQSPANAITSSDHPQSIAQAQDATANAARDHLAQQDALDDAREDASLDRYAEFGDDDDDDDDMDDMDDMDDDAFDPPPTDHSPGRAPLDPSPPQNSSAGHPSPGSARPRSPD